MTLDEFYAHWAAKLGQADREQFMLELAVLVTVEQARERRRLCTDERLYLQACEQTAAEIAQQQARPRRKATA
jgi:hypothetical protein